VAGSPAKELYHLYPGMILNDRYVVGRVLGFGGFGITYKVWDRRLNAVLAIKEYYPSGLVNRVPETKNVILFAGNRSKEYNHGLTRFLDEARNMAKFNSHKSIINVFEYFEENNTAYIVMEYLDGLSLSDYLKGNRLDMDGSISVILQVCTALKDIHAAGIVHRDVSPDNIFLCTNGAIKLIDFGAARFYADEEKQLTIILKPGFAPPEQYERVNIQGPWTDIYALGATLYQMVTGVKPEESTNRKISDTLAPPAQLDNKIPEYVSNTIMKAMAIDKHLRFISVADFEKALNQQKKVLPIAREKNRRKLRRLITVCASALVIIVAASVFFMNWNRQKDDETLPDAAISLWYSLSGDPDADQAKNDAYNAIVAAFNASFPNVTINVTTYQQSDYDTAIRSAASDGTLPALFESTGLSDEDLNSAVDLGNVVKSLDIGQCYFLDKYSTYFPGKKQMPLGFVAPVVYLNTTLMTFYDASLKDIGEITNESGADQTLAVDSGDVPAFTAAYGEQANAPTADAKDLFLSGKAVAYFADTGEYFDVQNALPARYKLLRIDSSDILASFCDMWSIGKCDNNELKAAQRLLVFMLSDNAQDYLHIRNRDGALPINKDVLDVFVSVYSDFNGFFDNIGSYTFQ